MVTDPVSMLRFYILEQTLPATGINVLMVIPLKKQSRTPLPTLTTNLKPFIKQRTSYQPPTGHELRIGRHTNGVGFFAEIIESETLVLRTWETISHGHTSERAIENAFCRFNDQPERLYEAKEFDL